MCHPAPVGRTQAPGERGCTFAPLMHVNRDRAAGRTIQALSSVTDVFSRDRRCAAPPGGKDTMTDPRFEALEDRASRPNWTTRNAARWRR